jgi:arginyl-tRNA synthetase
VPKLVAQLEGAVADLPPDRLATIELRRRAEPYADVRLLFGPPGERIPRLAQRLAALPAVASVRSRGMTVSLRLRDDAVASLGRTLEDGQLPAVSTAALADPAPVAVGFLGPNISKPLHLGHLRNAVLGSALTSVLASAGVPTHSYSLVGDIGRNMCEALAGQQLLDGADTCSPPSLKPDHLVGRWYRAYIEHSGATCDADDDADPCRREGTTQADLADALLTAWRRGEPAIRERWRQLCDMVERGHEATLRELGVSVDRCWYESAHVEHAVSILRWGVRQGILRELLDGSVVFDSGRPEFRRIVLLRPDGFPTEYARVVAVFHRIFTEPHTRLVHVDWNGTEWAPAQAVLEELMRRLDLIPEQVEHRMLFHGMVLQDGAAMSSSRPSAVLIDEVIDMLRRSREVVDLAGGSADTVSPGVVADLVLRAFFLCAPLAKPLAYSPARLLDPAGNPGWTIAKAWCRAQAQSRPGPAPSPDPAHDPSYRLAVLQGQAFAIELHRTAATLHLPHLTRFLVRYADGYLSAGAGCRTARVAQTVLAGALRSLGFRL